MTEAIPPTPPTPAPKAEPAPPAAAPVPAPADREQIIAGFFERIARGEFDDKSFHRFVVEEIYPLLGKGTLSVKDFERITREYARYYDPYNRGLGATVKREPAK